MQILPASSTQPTFAVPPVAPVRRQDPEAAQRQRADAPKAPGTGLIFDIKA